MIMRQRSASACPVVLRKQARQGGGITAIARPLPAACQPCDCWLQAFLLISATSVAAVEPMGVSMHEWHRRAGGQDSTRH